MAVKQLKEQNEDTNYEKKIYLFGDSTLAFAYGDSAKDRISKSIKLLQRDLSMLKTLGNYKKVLYDLAFVQEEINAAIDDVTKADDAATPGKYK